MKRPLGITALALLLSYGTVHGFIMLLGFALLGDTSTMRMLVQNTVIPDVVFGGVAAVGLWKMRSWAYQAFII